MSKALIKILGDKATASYASEDVAFSVGDLIQEANRLPIESSGSDGFAKAAEALSHIAECCIASNVALGRFRGASAPVTPGPSGRGAAGGGRQRNATRDPSPSPSVVSAAGIIAGASGAKRPRLDAAATPANPVTTRRGWSRRTRQGLRPRGAARPHDKGAAPAAAAAAAAANGDP
jgi:hypothetical protein